MTLPLPKLVFYLNFFSFLFLLPYRAFTGPAFSFNATTIGIGLGVAFSCSVLATILFQFGTSQIGAQKAALLSTFEPLTSVIVGALFMGEVMTSTSFLGMALVLLASFILVFEKKKAT